MGGGAIAVGGLGIPEVRANTGEGLLEECETGLLGGGTRGLTEANDGSMLSLIGLDVPRDTGAGGWRRGSGGGCLTLRIGGLLVGGVETGCSDCCISLPT